MTDGKAHPGDLEAFQHLLDGYGSDRTRWPARSGSNLLVSWPAIPTPSAFIARQRLSIICSISLRGRRATRRLLVDRIAAAAVPELPDETPRWQAAELEALHGAPVRA